MQISELIQALSLNPGTTVEVTSYNPVLDEHLVMKITEVVVGSERTSLVVEVDEERTRERNELSTQGGRPE